MGFQEFGFDENSRLIGKFREDSMSIMGEKSGMHAPCEEEAAIAAPSFISDNTVNFFDF